MQYSIIFAGKILPGFQLDVVKQTLGQRMKLSAQQQDQLFSGQQVPIKRNLDESTARKYRDYLRSLGADASVSPVLPEDSQPALSLTAIAPAPKVGRGNSVQPESNPYQSPVQGQRKLYCRQCGSSVTPQMTKCPACGADQEIGKARSKYVAAALAFFLGGLGAHRFYLGQWWGVFYILFYVIMWPVSIIESIVFLLTPQASWERKYDNVKSLGWVVVLIVMLFGGTALIGILAAVSIPAYQDYTLRAKVAQAIEESETYRDQMEAFVARTGFVPSANLDMGLPDKVQTTHIDALTVGDNGVMTLELRGHASLEGQAMVWTPDFSSTPVQWRCDGGNLRNKYRPTRCRTAEDQTATAERNGGREVTSESGQESLFLPAGEWEAQPLDSAQIIYFDKRKDVGIVVVRESRLDFEPGTNAEAFANLLKENAFADFSDTAFENHGAHPINQMPAQLFSFTAYSDGMAIRGLVAAVEGRDYFYKVMTWTARSKYERQYSTMLQMVESFRGHSQ